MTTQVLFARIRPELRQAVFMEAIERRRKVSAQVEVIIEEWLRLRDAANSPHVPEPAASDSKGGAA